MAPTRVIFSDIDGTIMHDPTETDRDAELLVTPPSASGRQGVISAKTIYQIAKLREQGAKFVVITGARLSTLLMRLPFLPQGDAFVCENGGRIFYPGSPLPTACPITEDQEWRNSQLAAGPANQATVEPHQMQGVLWSWYNKLKAEGWRLDANGYTTSFRIHAKDGKTLEQLQEVITQRPAELSCSFNLGAADFYPATSGKVEAARYLMDKFGAATENCTFLCDDDNDMELAAVIGKVFLPSITSDSVRQAVAARPDHFVTATLEGTAATEEMVEALAAHYNMDTWSPTPEMAAASN